MDKDLWIAKWGLMQLCGREHFTSFSDSFSYFDYKSLNKLVEMRGKYRKLEPNKLEEEDFNSYSRLIDIIENKKEVIQVNCRISNNAILNESSGFNFKYPIQIEISAKKLFEYNHINHSEFENIKNDFSIYVLYDGYFYLIYWLGFDINNLNIASVAKKWLKDVLSDSESFFVYETPPGLFSEEIRAKFTRDKTTEQYKIKSKDKQILRTIYFVELPEKKNVHNFYEYFHSMIQIDFHEYFELIYSRAAIVKLQTNMRKNYENLTEYSRQFQCLSIKDLKKHRTLRKQIRSIIVTFFYISPYYQNLYANYQSNKANLLSNFPENDYLKDYSFKLKHRLELGQDDFHLFQLLIEHTRDLLASNDGYRHNISTTIIGAIAGGIMGFIAGKM